MPRTRRPSTRKPSTRKPGAGKVVTRVTALLAPVAIGIAGGHMASAQAAQDRPGDSRPQGDQPRSEQQHAEQARRAQPERQTGGDRVPPHAEAQNRETAQREQRQQEAARREQDRGDRERGASTQGDRPAEGNRPAQQDPEARRADRPQIPPKERGSTPRADSPEGRPHETRVDPGLTPPAPRGDVRQVSYRDGHGHEFRVPTNDRVKVVTGRQDAGWTAPGRGQAIEGCPAAISGKYQGCNLPPRTHPPEKAWHDPRWFSRDFDDDTRYRYSEGYLLRLGGASGGAPGGSSAVVGYTPLLGGALTVGRAWPGTYRPIALPGYYTRYYGLGGEGSYRYYDNTIYRVNAGDAAAADPTITGIAALLLGETIRIGQPMPGGYDVYNVPGRYRDQYRDGPDALYRYSDGYIYQLEPATRLVRAAIELIA